jgi:hypothetical protein
MSQTADQPPKNRTSWRTTDFSLSYRDILKSLTWLAVAVGLLLRILEYTDNRQLYMDEGFILENFTDLPIWDLHTVLLHDQLAPPGFLIIERIMVRLPLPVVPTARFIPFVAALATMFYFPKVARRYIDPRAVPLATALFALGDYSIYYASEIKQYSVEVALALMALGLAARVEDESLEGRRQRLTILAVFGIVGVWFSFPLIFSLAGVGLAGLATQIRRKDWNQAGVWVAIGLAWLVSFGGCFLVSDRIVTKAPFLRVWWDFAFLRIPPHSMAEAVGVFWQFVNVVVDPTGVVTPAPHVWTGLLGGAVGLIGLVALTRRSPAKALIVAAPFVFAAAAAALKHYPFHGRLIQFLIPSVLFMLAEGVAVISRRGRIGLGAGVVLSAFLLIQPAGDAVYYRIVQPRARPFDSHGDLHGDLLDELEFRAKAARLQGR